MSKIKSIRGMKDLIPEEIGVWQSIEASIRSVFSLYGFEEIRLPLIEKSELFDRSVGDVSDIVSKEMYVFEDRSGEAIALRPEGTAGCVRACLENDLIRVDKPKLWYMGQMYRYERPQKGRSRQFHQASAEIFGIDSYLADAELILLLNNLWNKLGIQNKLSLEINSLGNYQTREVYRKAIQDFFNSYKKELDKDSHRILRDNPLRILDSKSKDIQQLLEEAPEINEYLDKESKDHLNNLKNILDKSNVPYSINNRLVRGLDYYNKTVFEWKAEGLGAQDTVCGGGRYDNLVEQLGGNSCPAVGFSIGLERLILTLGDSYKQESIQKPLCDAYFICLTEEAFTYSILSAEKIRTIFPDIKLKLSLEATSANSQFKKADKSGAEFTLIVGDEELKDNTISFKHLRDGSKQETFNFDQLIKNIKKIL
tara:strand:- start:1293 stop:2567 length:1275 start_codon:yes stop_codon:yes gene_type:complete